MFDNSRAQMNESVVLLTPLHNANYATNFYVDTL